MPDQDLPEFDLVVLGGGPGGYAAALYGASAGMNIAIVEEQRLGGTCLNRGCIPAKELLQTAEVLRTVKGAAEFGVHAPAPTIELGETQVRKQAVVDRLVGGLESLLKNRKVTIVAGTGVLLADARTIRVSDGTEVRGRNVIVATGSAPRALGVPGFEFDGTQVLSSDHVLNVDRVPARVAVVGGGAIGCEFASFLVDVGAEVTILEALPQVLAGVDQQVAQTVVRAFTKRGIKVQTGVRITGLERGATDVAVRYEAQGRRRAAPRRSSGRQRRAPPALGRHRPRRRRREGRRAWVHLGRRQHAHERRTACTRSATSSRPRSSPTSRSPRGSSRSRRCWAKRRRRSTTTRCPGASTAIRRSRSAGSPKPRPSERGLDVETSVHRWGGNGRALIIGESDGMMKIVAARGGAILGVHVAGPWATELIAEGYLAVNWEATPGDIGLLIHAHPTLSELFGESALALTGRSLHG